MMSLIGRRIIKAMAVMAVMVVQHATLYSTNTNHARVSSMGV